MADIKVGVILDTTGVKGQAAKAGQDIKREAEQNGRGLTSKSSAEMQADWRNRQGAIVREANRAFRQRAAAAASAESTAARATMQRQALNAGSAFAGRFGLSGLGTAARAGAVGIAIAGVVAGLVALGKALHETFQAIESARQMYAKQLTSGGLPGGYITKRSVLADIIGVGEREVMQYGRAVQYLNERIKLSVEDINRTNRTLTATSWNFKLLGVNLQAMWAEVAAALAPLMNMFADLSSAVIEFVRETGLLEGAAQMATYVIRILVAAMATLVGGMAATALAFVAIGDAIQYFLRQVNNSMARMGVPGFKVDSSDPFKETKAGAEAIKKMFEAIFKRKDLPVQVPESSSSYRRLQASPWEKMGLVIGAGVGNNPLQATARNTKKTADTLEKIKNFLTPRSSGSNRLPMGQVNAA